MTVLVVDTFTETSDTLLTSHTPDTGTGWTEQINTSALTVDVSGALDTVTPSGTENSVRIISTAQPDPTEADVDVFCTLAAIPNAGSDDPCGLIARYQDTTNMYTAGTLRAAAGTDKRIAKITGSFPGTLIASGDNGMTAGDKLKFELRGSTLNLYHDTGSGFGVPILSVPDGDITAAGESGLFWGNALNSATHDIRASWRLDDFGSDEFAAGVGNPKGPLGMPLVGPFGGPV